MLFPITYNFLDEAGPFTIEVRVDGRYACPERGVFTAPNREPGSSSTADRLEENENAR